MESNGNLKMYSTLKLQAAYSMPKKIKVKIVSTFTVKIVSLKSALLNSIIQKEWTTEITRFIFKNFYDKHNDGGS